MTNRIRYRFAMVLIWAAVGLVTNPVSHAAGHLFSDHSQDTTESFSDILWAEEDICPYCDAVSQFVEPPAATSLHAQLEWLEEVAPSSEGYSDLRLFLSTRLRAPPFLA